MSQKKPLILRAKFLCLALITGALLAPSSALIVVAWPKVRDGLGFPGARVRDFAVSTNRLARRPRPICCSTRTIRSTGGRGGRRRWPKAKRENKPILLSVGYAACHWCHVMAHESFEDEATARVMNELFVNIKVDREERPDIDQIYMNALHLLGEQGGWPLTMFLTPDGRAGVGRHVFPERQRASAGRPSSTCCAKWRGCSARSPARSSRTARRCWRGWRRRRGRRAR